MPNRVAPHFPIPVTSLLKGLGGSAPPAFSLHICLSLASFPSHVQHSPAGDSWLQHLQHLGVSTTAQASLSQLYIVASLDLFLTVTSALPYVAWSQCLSETGGRIDNNLILVFLMLPKLMPCAWSCHIWLPSLGSLNSFNHFSCSFPVFKQEQATP